MGAFGKHPGWNDHIDDIGLDTQRLIDFKRRLYLDGIGACVESGRWDRLGPGQSVPGFAHVFMFRGGGDVLIGRMWSSQDGKGRTRYPMVLCVHIRGAGIDECLRMALPPLERAQAKCEAVTSAEEVVRIVADLTESLRVQAAALDARRGDSRESIGGLRDLADHPSLGPARRGYHRVMYQIEHELAPFLRGQGTSRSSRSPDVQTRQVRLPACWSDPAEVLSRWSGALATRVDPYFPALFILPLGADWLDVIVGELSGPELFCLRASSRLVPPVSEIPYTIEPDQAFRFDQMANEPARAPADRGAGADGGSGAGQSRQPSGTTRADPRNGRTVLMVALLLAALLVGAVLWLVLDSRRSARAADVPTTNPVARWATVGSSITARGARLIGDALALSLCAATVEPSPGLIVAHGGSAGGGGGGPESPPPRPAAEAPLTADSPAINALWSEQQQRMRDFYSASDESDRAAHAQRLRDALESLDRRTPASINVGAAGEGGTGWPSALSRELARRREAHFSDVFRAWQGQLIDPANEPVREALDRLQSDGVRDAGEFTRLAADLSLVEHALNGIVGLDVPLAGGASAETIIGRWEADGLLRERGVREAVAPVLGRVAALREVQSESDTDRLLARTAASARPEPEIVVAVWRRLGRRLGVTWPASGKDVAEEARLGRAILAIADVMRDKSRAQALRAELADVQRRRLERLLATADRADQYDAAVRAIGVLGMKPEDFDARTRFNLLLHAFKKSLGETGGGTPPSAARPDDSAARRLAEDFLNQARALPGGLPYLADAAATISTVEGLLHDQNGLTGATDGTRLGPASTGKFTGRRDGDRLIFTLNGGDIPGSGGRAGVGNTLALEFVRIVPPDGGRPFFLGTTEVSVEMFVAMARAGGARDALRSLVLVTDPASDPRVGPRTWEWDASRTTLVPARRWLTVGLGILDDQYALGESVDAPQPGSPMQWITPRSAASAAAMVGCRLPSREEWNAACSRYAAALAPGDCNLRDQTWTRHKQFVDKQLALGRNVQAAAAGSYAPSDGPVGPADDGILWFAPVDSGGGSPVHHLWGNVAEFVLDADQELAPTDLGSKAAGDFMERHGAGLFIAGSSSLAPFAPALDAPRPTTLGEAVEGFSDVGFRLAFGGGDVEEGETSLAARIDRALTPTPYLTNSR